MNTANLQLKGLIMAMASICDAIVEKELLTSGELNAALAKAKQAVEDDDDHELSDANRAAILFPIRVLQLAEEAGRRGERLTFSDYAKLVGKMT
ncbi:hypothetical protein ACU8NH_29665 (plasmid) [Rhizobium leguminosarum]|jgi:hypothetical protein|uniref:Uncharacterized protein n=3 Tax=Rhizobium leguminosarum TaxID=384 RepID=A0A1B8RIB8_RHILT|nr:hypothetical protein [Rhizobium leguminosarum]MDH6660339.1 hypothetical protein [Rhizobium sophorae]AOO88336.1 hypothetical protein [Rhizobium leguminosarum bv. trifolii]ASS58465.1 hypothetical protein CHR56_28190 [Rhizobium leguminosarum bv. viciae]AVC46693.1 hypothetical protein RLV_1029 [Rhizobium leguminosarum bv. viciae]MBB4329520.1 hypothetical protein [Rhizobium leguminosarum]